MYSFLGKITRFYLQNYVIIHLYFEYNVNMHLVYCTRLTCLSFLDMIHLATVYSVIKIIIIITKIIVVTNLFSSLTVLIVRDESKINQSILGGGGEDIWG